MHLLAPQTPRWAGRCGGSRRGGRQAGSGRRAELHAPPFLSLGSTRWVRGSGWRAEAQSSRCWNTKREQALRPAPRFSHTHFSLGTGPLGGLSRRTRASACPQEPPLSLEPSAPKARSEGAASIPSPTIPVAPGSSFAQRTRASHTPTAGSRQRARGGLGRPGCGSTALPRSPLQGAFPVSPL